MDFERYQYVAHRNGGNNWQKLYLYNTLGGKFINDFHFVTSKIGWVVTEDKVYRTNDGGVSWTSQYSQNWLTPQLDCIFFPDTLHGWVAGWDGQILRTSNGGLTWEEELHNGEFIFDLFFVNDSVGWTAGAFAEIRKRAGIPNIWISADRDTFCQYSQDVVYLHGHSNALATNFHWFLDDDPTVYDNGPQVGIPSWLSPGIHYFRARIYQSEYCNVFSEPYYFTVYPQVNANISGPHSLCRGKTATLTVAPAEAYLWSTGETTQSISVMPDTNAVYAVTVTGAGGCTDTDTHSITSNSNPVATISPADTSICSGRSVKLTASGGGNYLWNTGNILPSFTITPTATTTYSVIVTNNSSCKDTAWTTVIVNPTPTVELGTHPPICSGESVILSPTGTPGAYRWNTGDTTSSITVMPLSSKQYRVTVTTPAGCTKEDWIFISVQPGTAAAAGPDLAVCAGQIATLSASGGTDYQWNTGQTGAQIQVAPSQTTTYHVTVSNSGACPGYDSVTVQVVDIPFVDAGPDQTVCAGQSVSLSASGGSGNYQWNTGQSGAEITVQPTENTLYSVLSSDPSGLCVAMDEVLVVVAPLPNADAGSDQIICYGQTATLSASGSSGGYSWSNGESGAVISISPASSQLLTLFVTSPQGCISTDEVLITVVPPDEIGAVTAQNGFLGCAIIDSMGCYATFPNAAYQWSGPGNFQSQDPFPPATLAGDYLVVATNPVNGCTSTASAFLMVDMSEPVIALDELTPDHNGQGTGSIRVSANGGFPPLHFEWWHDGLQVGSDAVLSGLNAGEYTCVVSGANACSSTAVFNVSNTVGLDEAPGSQFRLWPNPVTERLSIFGLQDANTWEVVDLQGRRRSISAALDNGLLQLDVTRLIPGCYLLRIRLEDGTPLQLPFIKQ